MNLEDLELHQIRQMQQPQTETPEPDYTATLAQISSNIQQVVGLISNLQDIVPEATEVTNLDEVKLYLREELTRAVKPLIDSIKSIPVPRETKEVSINNYPDFKAYVDSIITQLKTLTPLPFPEIKIPEPKVTVNVPEPQVTVQPTPVVLDTTTVEALLLHLADLLRPLQQVSSKASSPISVRLSDGKMFMRALRPVKDALDKQNQFIVTAARGLNQDEYQTTIRTMDSVLTPYQIADKDDDASPNYYGFTRPDGYWYILKETVSAGADTYRYATGTSAYTTAWTGRAGLSYDYFDVKF